MAELIVFENEKHTIHDEYIGFSYDVDKAFKPAKSHAGEIELLAVYAPDTSYGSRADSPYFAVQEDDAVYCAIDAFKNNGTFEGAIELIPLTGRFLFRAKREYFGNMMYFYAFESEGGHWTQAGLCLVYSKEYVGTDIEKMLILLLDEAAASCKYEYFPE